MPLDPNRQGQDLQHKGWAAWTNEDGSIVIYDIQAPDTAIATIPAGGEGAVDLPDGTRAVRDASGAVSVQARGAPTQAPAQPQATQTKPGGPAGLVASQFPQVGAGRYPEEPGRRFGGQTVAPSATYPAVPKEGRGAGWGPVGAGTEGIQYGYGVPAPGKPLTTIRKEYLDPLTRPDISPGYVAGSGTYNQYPLDKPGLFGPVGPQGVTSNLRYGLGGTGDPTTGGEVQTPRRFITGNPADTDQAVFGDEAWRRQYGAAGGGGPARYGSGGPARYGSGGPARYGSGGPARYGSGDPSEEAGVAYRGEHVMDDEEADYLQGAGGGEGGAGTALVPYGGQYTGAPLTEDQGGGAGGMGGGDSYFTSTVTSNWGQTPETQGLDYIATMFLRPDTTTGINTAAWSAPIQYWQGLAQQIASGRIKVNKPEAWAMLNQKGFTPQNIGGAALTGLQPSGQQGTALAGAGAQGAQGAAPQTSEFGVSGTMAEGTQTPFGPIQGGLPGGFNIAWHDLQDKMEEERFQRLVAEARLTGVFNGKTTLEAQQIEANIRSQARRDTVAELAENRQLREQMFSEAYRNAQLAQNERRLTADIKYQEDQIAVKREEIAEHERTGDKDRAQRERENLRQMEFQLAQLKQQAEIATGYVSGRATVEMQRLLSEQQQKAYERAANPAMAFENELARGATGWNAPGIGAPPQGVPGVTAPGQSIEDFMRQGGWAGTPYGPSQGAVGPYGPQTPPGLPGATLPSMAGYQVGPDGSLVPVAPGQPGQPGQDGQAPLPPEVTGDPGGMQYWGGSPTFNEGTGTYMTPEQMQQYAQQMAAYKQQYLAQQQGQVGYQPMQPMQPWTLQGGPSSNLFTQQQDGQVGYPGQAASAAAQLVSGSMGGYGAVPVRTPASVEAFKGGWAMPGVGSYGTSSSTQNAQQAAITPEQVRLQNLKTTRRMSPVTRQIIGSFAAAGGVDKDTFQDLSSKGAPGAQTAGSSYSMR